MHVHQKEMLRIMRKNFSSKIFGENGIEKNDELFIHELVSAILNKR